MIFRIPFQKFIFERRKQRINSLALDVVKLRGPAVKDPLTQLLAILGSCVKYMFLYRYWTDIPKVLLFRNAGSILFSIFIRFQRFNFFLVLRVTLFYF